MRKYESIKILINAQTADRLSMRPSDNQPDSQKCNFRLELADKSSTGFSLNNYQQHLFTQFTRQTLAHAHTHCLAM